MNPILSKDAVQEWGLGSLPEAKQIEMVERIGRLLYQSILVKSLDMLSEQDEAEFDLLLNEDTTTPENVLAFLKTKIPSFDQMVFDARKSLKEDLFLPTK